jgi:hypothetical protein
MNSQQREPGLAADDASSGTLSFDRSAGGANAREHGAQANDWLLFAASTLPEVPPVW